MNLKEKAIQSMKDLMTEQQAAERALQEKNNAKEELRMVKEKLRRQTLVNTEFNKKNQESFEDLIKEQEATQRAVEQKNQLQEKLRRLQAQVKRDR
eukprot:UN20357